MVVVWRGSGPQPHLSCCCRSGPSGPQPQAFSSRSSPFSSQSPPFAPEYTLGLQSKILRFKHTCSAVSEDIEHRFFRASESGKEVSRMLEASKIRVGYSDAKGGSAVSDFLAALRLTCCRGNAVLVSHVYEAAQSSMAAFKKWRMGGPRFQKASVLGRKRRPSD
ncbi:hypothetical protein RHGRI_015976 [Rhododendron griersonianum]|uniref:DUF632 domain-containing protein n=1 Tax=Rhododendron griersonianum TaxID=479676 RepID=A0AAV6JQS6_9ERIC|nr:hypothetical protein RHGRI_015976 [Rhododendron griersonianum]